MRYPSLAVSLAALAASVAAGQSANTTTILALDTAQRYQSITGFGFSEAFQRAYNIINLPEPQRSELVDLLFNTTTGAGFSILRNGLGSSPNSTQDFMNTIEPVSPGAPGNTPEYVFDGKDSGQLWVSQQAARYGVKTFYSDAWAAPGFMKTNGLDYGGGTLCGVPDGECPSGDWRQAYADYLVRYLQFYKDAGIQVTHLGFLNEPDLSTSYASMVMNGTQAADFVKVLAPALRANPNFTDTKIACCDATGWRAQADLTRGLAAGGADGLVGVVTGHGYSSPVDFAQPTPHEVWETEYSDLEGNWSVAWDSAAPADVDGGRAGASGTGDGLLWANNIHAGLTAGNVSAYLWWVATQDQVTNGDKNEKLIRVDNTTDTYQVSRRFWAFAQYSRVVRPGAVRVGLGADGAALLNSTAFVNEDGSVVVSIINNGREDTPLSVALGDVEAGDARAWLTNEQYEYEEIDTDISEDGSAVSVLVPARALVSVLISPARPGEADV